MHYQTYDQALKKKKKKISPKDFEDFVKEKRVVYPLTPTSVFQGSPSRSRLLVVQLHGCWEKKTW